MYLNKDLVSVICGARVNNISRVDVGTVVCSITSDPCVIRSQVRVNMAEVEWPWQYSFPPFFT